MTKNEWILRLRRCTSGETLEKVIEKISIRFQILNLSILTLPWIIAWQS